MTDPISLLVALLALAHSKRATPAAAAQTSEAKPTTKPAVSPAAQPAAKPAGRVTTLPEVVITAKPPTTTAKPTIVPAVFQQVPATDLPKFPSGWEPDVPVPADVSKRAAALIPTLWKSGKPGATKQEKTGDHWVTYKGFVPAKGKRGVAAYRVMPGQPGAPPEGDINV